MRNGEGQHDAEEDDEGDDQQAQRLDDGGVAQEGQDRLNRHRQDDEDDLGRVTGEEAGLDHQHQRGADNEDEPLHFEADLGHPVEQGDRPGSVGSEGRAVDGEDGGACLRALQRAKPEQEIRQVAQHDHDDHLGERQPEGHEDGAVNEVLDLHAGPGPHAEDVLGRGPALALGDEVDPVLFDLEGILHVGLVHDGQILGNRHRQYLLVVASRRRGRPAGRPEDGLVPWPPPGGLPRSHVHAPTCQVPARVPGERPKVCRPTQCARADLPVKWWL